MQKYTRSEEHEVVSKKETDAIRRVAGTSSAGNLEEAEKEKLLRELEAARRN